MLLIHQNCTQVQPVLKVVSLQEVGAELAMNDRVVGGHEGVGSGRGAPSPVGVGSGASQKIV